MENRKDYEELIQFPSELDTRLWVAFNRVQQAVHRSMDSEMKKRGLPSVKWYDVLWSLERIGGEGLRAFELEHIALFEQSNLSRLLARMVREGFIEEFRCPSDGRGKIYQITDKGKDLRLEMWQVYGPLIQKQMSHFANLIPAEEVIEGLYSMVGDSVYRNDK